MRDGFNSSPIKGEPPAAPNLNDALQQQLGLQRVSKRLPFNVLIIDLIDRLPTDN